MSQLNFHSVATVTASLSWTTHGGGRTTEGGSVSHSRASTVHSSHMSLNRRCWRNRAAWVRESGSEPPGPLLRRPFRARGTSL